MVHILFISLLWLKYMGNRFLLNQHTHCMHFTNNSMIFILNFFEVNVLKNNNGKAIILALKHTLLLRTKIH